MSCLYAGLTLLWASKLCSRPMEGLKRWHALLMTVLTSLCRPCFVCSIHTSASRYDVGTITQVLDLTRVDESLRGFVGGFVHGRYSDSYCKEISVVSGECYNRWLDYSSVAIRSRAAKTPGSLSVTFHQTRHRALMTAPTNLNFARPALVRRNRAS